MTVKAIDQDIQDLGLRLAKLFDTPDPEYDGRGAESGKAYKAAMEAKQRETAAITIQAVTMLMNDIRRIATALEAKFIDQW